MKPIPGPDQGPVGGGAPSVPGAGLIPGARAFLTAVDLLNRLPFGDSAIQEANRRAARAAGYTGDRATLNAIGEGLRNAAEFAAQTADRSRAAGIAAGTRNLPATIPGQAPPFNPPDVYRPPPKAPPAAPPPWNPAPLPGGTPPINPTGGVGPIVPVFDVGAAIGKIWDLNIWLTSGINRAIFGPRPTSRPAGPADRGGASAGRAPPGRGDPFPPQGSPPQGSPAAPAARAERIPRAERVQARLDELGGDIYVNPRRLPVPAAPPASIPKVPLWMQLLGIVGPSLLGALMPAQGNRNVLRLTDPLTRPVTDGNPFPLTRSQTSVQSFGAFGGGAVGSNTCECKAPPKKRRRKKRTVCYSGTFIERADGTRKTKKRKVQC